MLCCRPQFSSLTLHVLVLFTITIYQLVKCDRSSSSHSSCSRAVPFDYITLALQWPPGVCWARKTDCIGVDNKFMIHGTWPSFKNGSWPEYCCFNRNLDTKNIKEIEHQLRESWRTLFPEGTDESFWTHEWKKHGTCASSSAILKGQNNYFLETLQLYSKTKIQEWLKQSNIIPLPPNRSMSFSPSEYHAAIEKQIGKRVRLECRRLPRKLTLEPVLSGIYVCFEPMSLKYVDCPNNDDLECGSHKIKFIAYGDNVVNGCNKSILTNNYGLIMLNLMITLWMSRRLFEWHLNRRQYTS